MFQSSVQLILGVINRSDGKKLVETLLVDLRSLSTEARKKHNHVKEVSSHILLLSLCSLVSSLSCLNECYVPKIPGADAVPLTALLRARMHDL